LGAKFDISYLGKNVRTEGESERERERERERQDHIDIEDSIMRSITVYTPH
jgi:hypothetical protein